MGFSEGRSGRCCLADRDSKKRAAEIGRRMLTVRLYVVVCHVATCVTSICRVASNQRQTPLASSRFLSRSDRATTNGRLHPWFRCRSVVVCGPRQFESEWPRLVELPPSLGGAGPRLIHRHSRLHTECVWSSLGAKSQAELHLERTLNAHVGTVFVWCW